MSTNLLDGGLLNVNERCSLALVTFRELSYREVARLLNDSGAAPLQTLVALLIGDAYAD